MKSLYNFIVEPKNKERYNNTIKVGNVDLVVNTSIEDAKDVQRIGIVKSVPLLYNTEIKVDDEVVLWHNIFRIIYDNKGVPVESERYIKDDLFYVEPDLVYMVIRDGKKIAIHENVFVEPLKIHDKWEGEKEHQHVGIIKYANQKLLNSGLKEGDKIAYRKNCEYEFTIGNERLYLMKNNRILAKLN